MHARCSKASKEHSYSPERRCGQLCDMHHYQGEGSGWVSSGSKALQVEWCDAQLLWREKLGA